MLSSYPYADNTTLEDLIVQAGGLLDDASTVRVDVSRRLKNPKSLEATTQLSETFTFALKDGFVIDGTPGFILYPYDMVEVRRSPGYQEQHRVKIGGEVVFAGGYTLQQKNERLSDLVKRAGKSSAEASVRFAETWIVAALRDRKFFSLRELNEAVAEKLDELNSRPFKQMAGCRRSAYLEEEEKPYMLPLPVSAFAPATHLTCLRIISHHMPATSLE